jgi:hypothetical protein
LNLRIEGGQQFAGAQFVEGVARCWWLRRLTGELLASLPPDFPAPRVACHLAGDAVQPARQAIRGADGRGLFGEDEEHCLHSVLDLIQIAQDPPANSQGQRRVSGDQDREGALVSVLNEAAKQLRIGAQVCIATGHQPMDLTAQALGSSGHQRSSKTPIAYVSLNNVLRGAGEPNAFFAE